MKPTVGLDQCLSFISCQMHAPRVDYDQNAIGPYRSVTISRLAGAGGHSVGARLAELLQARTPDPNRPWTIFDRNLVEKVLEDHKLSRELARFMPEDRISELSDTLDELFGLHPPSWALVRDTADTVLKLAELGRVILIGRGGHIVTASLPYVFHVRLVGSLEKRVERVQQVNNVSRERALETIEQEDRGRARFIKKYFGGADIDDPSYYHLVINTDKLSIEKAAQLIVQAMTP